MKHLELLSNIKRLAALGCTVKVDNASLLIDDIGVSSYEAEGIQRKIATEIAIDPIGMVGKLQFCRRCKEHRITPVAERVRNGKVEFRLPSGRWIDEQWNEVKNEWDF